MYPYDILPGIDLYLIFLCLAVISALVIFRVMADKLKIKAKLQNLCIYTGVGAIIVGYLSAVIFQAFYNIQRDGGFVVNNGTGATFYGGLIGGAALFLAVYFIAGARIFKNKEHIERFFSVADAATCAICVAHAVGRIGCLMAGCCYGKYTTAWYGIYMQNLGYKVVPIPLIESMFLFLLFAYLFMRIRDKQTYCLQIYMAAYGIWRFVIEFMRNDYRGTTLISSITPSQLTAIVMIVVGVLLLLLQRKLQFAKVNVSEIEGTGVASAEYEEEEYEYEYGESDNAPEIKTEDDAEKKDEE